MKRRSFISSSAKIATGLAVANAIPFQQVLANRPRVSANDKVQVALIGCKGMGWTDLKSTLLRPEVECIGLYDSKATAILMCILPTLWVV
jgi:hypothetical protein